MANRTNAWLYGVGSAGGNRVVPVKWPMFRSQSDVFAPPPNAMGSGSNNANAQGSTSPTSVPMIEPKHPPFRPAGGRPKGVKNYTEFEKKCMFRAINEILPTTARGWSDVHARFLELVPDTDRTLASIKKLFKRFADEKFPTEDDIPPDHRKARSITKNIALKESFEEEKHKNSAEKPLPHDRTLGFDRDNLGHVRLAPDTFMNRTSFRGFPVPPAPNSPAVIVDSNVLQNLSRLANQIAGQMQTIANVVSNIGQYYLEVNNRILPDMMTANDQSDRDREEGELEHEDGAEYDAQRAVHAANAVAAAAAAAAAAASDGLVPTGQPPHQPDPDTIAEFSAAVDSAIGLVPEDDNQHTPGVEEPPPSDNRVTSTSEPSVVTEGAVELELLSDSSQISEQQHKEQQQQTLSDGDKLQTGRRTRKKRERDASEEETPNNSRRRVRVDE